ncbi:MAG: hypothetical protein OXI87_19470 [Albidovulum sp.]|nr:hypothetical protein [Albidovulum sp.]
MRRDLCEKPDHGLLCAARIPPPGLSGIAAGLRIRAAGKLLEQLDFVARLPVPPGKPAI